MRRLNCAFVVRIWQNKFSHDSHGSIIDVDVDHPQAIYMYFEVQENFYCVGSPEPISIKITPEESYLNRQ